MEYGDVIFYNCPIHIYKQHIEKINIEAAIG